MKNVYQSMLSSEINRYLKQLAENGRYIDRIRSSLRSLDKFLVMEGITYKTLKAETISAWIKTRNVSTGTKVLDINSVKGFARYLASLGIEADCPEAPKIKSDYVPYIFTDTELGHIFAAADNFEAGKLMTRSVLIFPILLRVLYGSGLRLAEGRSLRWKDVDLEKGILTIRKSKNLKQRFIPMDDSMAALLRDYRVMTHSDGICSDYLFESCRNPGKPFGNNAFEGWFKRVIEMADIHYIKKSRNERGPCPHCLRHCFTLKSFLKSETEGRCFEDFAPFLAAYLGHSSPSETETYLSSNHTVYTKSHQRVNSVLGHLFPEVDFDEE